MGGGSMSKMINFSRQQVGKPYVFGKSGPVCATLGFFTAAILAAERDQLRGRVDSLSAREVAEDA